MVSQYWSLLILNRSIYRSLLPLQQVSFALQQVSFDPEQVYLWVSFASIVGLFCLYSRSLLPLQQVSFALQQVSFASIVGLFCLYSRSLLPLQQVSFALQQVSFDPEQVYLQVSFENDCQLLGGEGDLGGVFCTKGAWEERIMIPSLQIQESSVLQDISLIHF